MRVKDNLKYRYFFKTLYFCGLSKSEARALNRNDIDFKNNTLRII